MSTPKKRTRWRKHWRVRSAKRYAAARARARRCPWRQGRTVCGGLLEITVDRQGRTITRCPRCERREAGICRDCPNRIGRDHRLAMLCRTCKYKAKLAAQRRYYHRHAEDLRPKQAQWMRDYRATHPTFTAYWRAKAGDYRLERKRRALRGAA